MAELRLDISLNLDQFRLDLNRLVTEASNQQYKIDLLFDKQSIDSELKALEKLNPVLKINDAQIIAAKARVKTLDVSLQALRKATATPIEIKIKYVEIGKPPSGATEQIANTVSRGVKVSQAIEGFSSGQLRSTRRAMIEAGIKPGDIANLIKASTDELNKSIVHGFNNSGQEAINGFVAGLNDGKSKIAFAAGKVGKEGIRGLNDALGVASPSKVFKQIGKFSVDGLEIGFLNGLKSFKSKSIAEVSAIVIALKAEFAKLQGALPAPASLRGGSRGGRGYFNSIGPLPEGSKEPYTMTDRGYQPYLGGPGVGPSAAPRGLLPPASAIGRGFSGQSFGGAPVNFKMGVDLPALPPSGTAERLRQQARVAQAHLRSAERSVTVFGERAAMLEKAMSAFRTSGRATGYTSPIGPLPRDSAEPYAAGSRGMFGKQGFEARLESRPIAGLLPPSSTPTREQIVKGRTEAARQRSNARALEVQLEDQFKKMQFEPTVPPRRDYFRTGMQPLLPGSGRSASYSPSTSQGGFRGFSQRAAQVQQGVGGGGGSALPAAINTSATVGNIKSLMSAINDLGGKAAGAASQIKNKASRALREVGDFISGEGRYDGGYGGGGMPPRSGGGVPPGGGGNPPIPPRGTEQVINFKTNASEISQEIKRVQDAIVKTVRASKTSLKLTLDTSKLDSGINASFNKLNRVISLAQKQLNKLQIGGADFNAQAEIVGSLEGKRERGENISNVIRLKAQAGAFEPGSLMRDQKVLEAMRIEASQIRPATQEWINLQQQIAQANLELQKTDQLAENIQLTQTLGALEPNSLAGLETKLTILRNKARDIRPDTKEWKALNKEIQDIEGNIAKATKRRMGGKERLGAAGGAFLYGGGLSGGAGSAIGGIGGGLIGGVPGAFTGAAIGQAVDDLGKMTAAMTEQATVIKKLKLGLASASNDFGDFAAANQEVERISNSLLIPLEDVYRKFTQLRASTVALGIDTKTTGQMFEGTAAAVLRSGGSMDDVDGAMRAVVQVFSKGKLTAEELRGQLAERLPGAVVEFAKSAGMSVQELDKAFEAGTTSIDQFVVFLKGKSKEGAAFAKEMETSSEYAGARMEQQFKKLQITIGQTFQPGGAAFQDFVTRMIKGSDRIIAKLIQIKLLQPGSDFYEAKAIDEGAAGPGNLENKLLQAMEDQRNIGESLDKVGAGFMKGVTAAYTDATNKVDIYGKALENIRKQENLTKQRKKDEKTAVLDEEQKKRASTFLDIVERREESLIQAREQHEEDIANIRQDAIKQVQDLERKYQDQRLQAERALGQVRRDLVSAQEEAGFLDREANAALTGEDPEVIDAARKGAETVRSYTEEKIRIEQTAQDRQIALSQDLENFKRINADAINKANQRYAINIGEIQKNYAKSVAKLIEEGSGNGAKRLAAAGKLVNALLNQATAQRSISAIAPGGIQQTDEGFFMGGAERNAQQTLDVAKKYNDTLYTLVKAYIDAVSQIDKATKELGSNLPVTAQPSTVAPTTVSTADLDANVRKAQAPLKEMGEQMDDANKKLNEQGNIFNNVSKIINGITDESGTNLRQIDRANKLTEERLTLIRQGVLPALAEEEATLKRSNELQIARVKAYFKSFEGKEISGKNMETLDRMSSDAINRINKVTTQTKAAQQESRDNAATTGRMQTLKDEIQLLSTAGDAERRLLELRNEGLSPGKAREIYNLEKVKKNLEDTKALIGNFVSSTSSDYKGFLKAVISGEDAVDALQKFQAGLADKVLTIFLDFAMAPMENMMKKSLEGLFMPKVKVDEVPVTANTNELTKNTNATIANTSAITGKIQVQPYDPTKNLPGIPDFSKNAFNISPESAFAGFNTESMFTGLDTENMFAGLNDQIRASLDSVSLSFTDAAFNLNTSAEPWKEALITDIPFALSSSNEQIATQGTTFSEGLTNVVGGIGAAAAGIAGIAAGISQIGKGGTSNVLGGIGSILMGAGGAIGGFGKIFGFADGGMVSQPTLGMVGEGKYNEAIVPLPNGRSIPVQFNQESSLRSAMGNNGSNNNPVSPVLNMSFETTKFGNTDYVSREQLEAAMMQTRAEATKAGARRGMTMTLDKLQQSPSTRSRVGLG